MAASKEQILEAISNMTIMEVVDLVKMMEDKFGVTAAAPVAMAAARGRRRRPGRRGEDRVHRHAQGLSGREESHGHQGDPRDHRSRPQGSQGPGGRRSVGVKEAVSKADAEKYKKQLEDAGATVEVK